MYKNPNRTGKMQEAARNSLLRGLKLERKDTKTCEKSLAVRAESCRFALDLGNPRRWNALQIRDVHQYPSLPIRRNCCPQTGRCRLRVGSRSDCKHTKQKPRQFAGAFHRKGNSLTSQPQSPEPASLRSPAAVASSSRPCLYTWRRRGTHSLEHLRSRG